MVALYAVWYNFVKMDKTLKMTPALAADVLASSIATTRWKTAIYLLDNASGCS
jgi:hypothetical protein